jgi:hypothetical protein
VRTENCQNVTRGEVSTCCWKSGAIDLLDTGLYKPSVYKNIGSVEHRAKCERQEVLVSQGWVYYSTSVHLILRCDEQSFCPHLWDGFFVNISFHFSGINDKEYNYQDIL